MTSKQDNMDQLLEDCLERMRQGASLDDVLRRHPDQAAELRPLLRIAQALKTADYLAPPQATRDRMRARFEGAARLRFEEKRQPRDGWSRAWMRPWTLGIASIATFLVMGGATLWASSGSLPNQPLYGLKRGMERIQVALASSPQDQASLHLDLADKRIDEIARLAQDGDAAALAGLGADVAQQIQLAQASLAMAAPPQEDLAFKAAGTESIDSDGGAPAPAPTPSRQDPAPASNEVSGFVAATASPEATEPATAITITGRSAAGDLEAATPVAQDQAKGWNLISMPETPDPLASLSAEERAFVLQVQDRATRNLALLYFLKLRAADSVRPAIQEVIDASVESYRAILQPYMGPATAQWDIRRQMAQVDARLERRGNEWKVAGRDIQITPETRILNAPETDRAFRVSGVTLPNGAFLALFIEHGASGDNGRDNEVHLFGAYAYDEGTATLSVGGFRLAPLSGVQMEGNIQEGGWARVLATLRPEGLTAHQIVAIDAP